MPAALFDPIDASVTLPSAGPAAVAVVMVPTFRRPAMLAQTLASLARQDAAFPFFVVVVDNDAKEQEGLALARDVFSKGTLHGIAVIEEQQGNCHAINRALATARATQPGARYWLMIDDDESASPDWLRLMVETCETHEVDVVGGPVEPVFERPQRADIANHPVFWPAFKVSGPVPMIYGSGNFLIRRESLDRLGLPAFDTRFNFLGGGDTDFFTRCRRAGFMFRWVAEAKIEEIVPAARTARGWILRRGLRTGAINYLIDRRHAAPGLGFWRVQAKNLVILPLSFWRALRTLLRGGGPLQVVHPVVVALGRISASLGLETEQYRAKPGA
jgi:GT2 family glycosyltransferase